MTTHSSQAADSVLVYRHGPHHPEAMVADLSRRAYEYRTHVLRMVYGRKSGHIGGAFSCAEILTALYFHHLRVDPERPDWGDRDRLVFSKGHACAMLYTVLAHRGFFPVAELPTFRGLNSRLQGHPEPQKTPGVEVAAGPLGHGVAVGAGMALAARMDGSKRKVYVILGDGELNSGVIWEGMMTAAKFALDNLKVIVDYNGVQQTGTTRQVMPTEPICRQMGRIQLARDRDSRPQHGADSRCAGPRGRSSRPAGGNYCAHYQGQGRELYGEFAGMAWRHTRRDTV